MTNTNTKFQDLENGDVFNTKAARYQKISDMEALVLMSEVGHIKAGSTVDFTLPLYSDVSIVPIREVGFEKLKKETRARLCGPRCKLKASKQLDLLQNEFDLTFTKRDLKVLNEQIDIYENNQNENTSTRQASSLHN